MFDETTYNNIVEKYGPDSIQAITYMRSTQSGAKAPVADIAPQPAPTTPAETPADTKPNINDYLRQKYNLQDVGEVEDQAALSNLLTGISQAAYTANRGTDPSMFNASRRASAQRVKDAKQSYNDALSMDRETKKQERENEYTDPSSKISKWYQNMAKKLGYEFAEGTTAQQFEAIGFKPFELEGKQKELDLKRDQLDEAKKAASAKKPLAAGQMTRRDQVTTAMRAIIAMDQQLANDSIFGTMPWVPTQFNTALIMFSNGVGRMESGGQIKNDEMEMYRRMAPHWRDSRENQIAKLKWLLAQMNDRGRDFGVQTDYQIQLGKKDPKQVDAVGLALNYVEPTNPNLNFKTGEGGVDNYKTAALPVYASEKGAHEAAVKTIKDEAKKAKKRGRPRTLEEKQAYIAKQKANRLNNPKIGDPEVQAQLKQLGPSKFKVREPEPEIASPMSYPGAAEIFNRNRPRKGQI